MNFRISALGIVGDLLRKVGALELKLVSTLFVRLNILISFLQVSCRNIVKENGKENAEKNGFSNIDNIDRSKKIPRGASSPAVINMCDANSWPIEFWLFRNMIFNKPVRLKVFSVDLSDHCKYLSYKCDYLAMIDHEN